MVIYLCKINDIHLQIPANFISFKKKKRLSLYKNNQQLILYYYTIKGGKNLWRI